MDRYSTNKFRAIVVFAYTPIYKELLALPFLHSGYFPYASAKVQKSAIAHNFSDGLTKKLSAFMLYDVRTLKTSLEPSLCFVKPFLSSPFLNLMLFSIIYLSIAAEYKVDSTVQ